ncbi:MAG: HD domain-containing protein [Candidatus Woesearchaeota archaeon]
MQKKAELLARTFHQGILLRCKEPQIQHLEGVVELIKEVGIKDDEIIAAAWLHDSLEDTDLDPLTIKKHTSARVMEYVQKLTRDTDREEYLHRIREAPYPVQIIKLADVMQNCSMLDRGLRDGTIDRLFTDCRNLYLSLAKRLNPGWYQRIKKYLRGDNGA